MTSNEYERDFTDPKVRRPGRIDLELFQNKAACFDGHPGLQRAFRNYLHEGGMEKDLDMNNHDINNITDVNAVNVNATDVNADVGNIITGNIDTLNADDVTITATLDASGTIEFNADLNMNSNDINNVDVINDTIFYCSTEVEINAAITAIGAGQGKIIITAGTINLAATITINIAGSVVIEGCGDNSIIACNGDRAAISIIGAQSATLRDFKILADGVALGTNIININEISDNKIMVDNLTIVNNALRRGYGIRIQSNNCTITGNTCNFNFDGIYNSGTDCTITGNTCNGNSGYGIRNDGGTSCTITGNTCNSNTTIGIRNTGNFVAIVGNCTRSGINNTGADCVVASNVIA